ncbi:hypothetical protein [Enterococcus sp. 12E11_DIV0728]|uniref:hypothetical protein n=1 Tax=Enterococcus sp. 12E11_DIV0728 TaxID=1834168 RepID=UPI000A3380F6|nr:hypothetical protein [Enterococcus sp. 12E11_DIV0728]OTO67791.1 hypothetical protein A5865_003470 [Enterococcus sp. 12E11_DIV0728]OUZ15729.1 hypothetical protein A5868_000640 [Enterococcus sp. 12F9_DIV0723]
MENNNFQKLRNDSWLSSGLLYGYVLFFFCLTNFFGFPTVFDLIFQLSTVVLFNHVRRKGQGKYKRAAKVGLVLSILLFLYSLPLFVWWLRCFFK